MGFTPLPFFVSIHPTTFVELLSMNFPHTRILEKFLPKFLPELHSAYVKIGLIFPGSGSCGGNIVYLSCSSLIVTTTATFEEMQS